MDIFRESKAKGYHLGHLFMSVMKMNPEELNQIDAATGEKETNASVLARSVRLAKCLRRFGLQPGDVMALAGRNHIDLHIPYYAAMLNGLPLVGVDHTFKYDEIHSLFKQTNPKIAFCQNGSAKDFERAAISLNFDTKIITFDEGDCTMTKFLDSYDEDGSLDGFEPASFDLDKVYVWLIGTGGTTGKSKIAAFKHKAWLTKTLQYLQMSISINKGKPKIKWSENLALNLSPLHWVSGFFNPIGMVMRNQCKIQTSEQTIDNVVDVINQYKPKFVLCGPPIIASILNNEKYCDLSCFDTIILTGGAVYTDILVRLKDRVSQNTRVLVMYGQTESMGPVMLPGPSGPIGNCGKPTPHTKLKLVDPETGAVVTAPNTKGELWTYGPSFTEYYNSPEETALAFSEDGWFKTGDIFYRDENDYYYFVERLKMLIKYRTQHVIPVELEELIRSHPGVLDAGVTSIPHPEDGEHPVACVVRRPGSDVTAEQIKELVAEKLSSSKQLRGGVVFLDKLPLTSTDKLARAALRKLVLTAKRE
ncbi:luciferin 4-monooxygenase-like [Plodia interpunctella]|uniref:luciferin 4-monooxygenase-like n=1 Tax=Plodia interpunctella TaxID=58824 RepID=UPI002368E490|nr:luciferin 4-monooxygenase-like [Plodia interpunctella]